MRALRRNVIGVFLCIASLTAAMDHALAQGSSEQKFQDVFITAGYATAFGAALGAASLSFYAEPAQHLRLIAIVASLGFIGGAILGTYIVLSPGVATENFDDGSTLLGSNAVPEQGIALRPSYDPDKRRITQVEGALTIASF